MPFALFPDMSFISPVARIVSPVAANFWFLASPRDVDVAIALVAHLINRKDSGVKISEASDCFGVREDVMKHICSRVSKLLTIADGYIKCRGKNFHLICYKHNTGDCQDADDCHRLHVCAKWLYGECEKERYACPLGHFIDNATNQQILKPLGIEFFNKREITLLALADQSRGFRVPPSDCHKSLFGGYGDKALDTSSRDSHHKSDTFHSFPCPGNSRVGNSGRPLSSVSPKQVPTT